MVLNQFFIISIVSHSNAEIIQKYNLWCPIIFNYFYEYPIQYNIKEKNFNWVDYFIEICKQNKEIIKFSKNTNCKAVENEYTKKVLTSIIYASHFQPNEQNQSFFDRIFSEVFNCGIEKSNLNDTIYPVSFKDDVSINYEPVHVANINFYCHLFNCFRFKRNLKFDVLIEQLENNINISPIYLPENDDGKFIIKYLKNNNFDNQEFPSYYYQSFPKGGSFFFNMPLYDSFITLFGIDNNCRIKIAQLLLNEKYEDLKVKLGIITLYKILSFICIDHPLIPKNNNNLYSIVSSYNNMYQITYGLPRYLSAFQLILGIQSSKLIDDLNIKEFFEYELARKIGIFDDFSIQNDGQSITEKSLVDQYNKMIFSFLYLSILFVVERILFNFDGKEFLRQQIIYSYKPGILKPNDALLYDLSILDDNSSIFPFLVNAANEAINSTFNKWNPITAAVPLICVYNVLLNEIASNPDKLIELQEFEPEETYFFKGNLFSSLTLSTRTSFYEGYDRENELGNSEGLNIRLKDLLMTPTVLAIVYHTLRTDSSSNRINSHLAMNILILISKFTENLDEHDIKSKKLLSNNVIRYETIKDLISVFRKDLFNYQIDDKGNASIDNNLIKYNFEYFLHLKIAFKDLEEKSIVDILIEKDKIGLSVLKTIGINPNQNINSDEKIKNKKPQSSKKVQKEEILNQFKKAQNNFQFDFIEEKDDDDDNEECPCNICKLHNPDEILAYPIYVYKTKLPCIFDKPPELKGISDSVSISSDDDIFQKDPIFYKNILDDQMEQCLKSVPGYSRMGLKIPNSAVISIIKKSRKTKEFFNKERKKRYEQRKKDLMNNTSKRYIAGANFILQYSLCPHLFHSSCVDTINDFKCPIDRNQRNCFLPCLTYLPKLTTSFNQNSLPVKVINSIKTFIELMKSHIVQSIFQKVDIFIELIKSISGIITTYEVYIRNNCNNLYLDEMKILARNLFLTTWYAFRIYEKPKMTNKIPYFMENDKGSEEYDVDSRLTIFQRFIKKLIENDNIEIEQEKEESFTHIIESFIESYQLKTKRDAKELWIFLRRIHLSKFFILGNTNLFNEEISCKWDDILSFSSMYLKYNVKFDFTYIKDDELFKIKPFRITNLPKEFIQFANKPFNYPIDDLSKSTYYNLLDYNLLIDYYDDLEENDGNEDNKKLEMIEKRKYMEFNDDIEFEFAFQRKNYPVFSLSLTVDSSKMQKHHNDLITNYSTFYLDEHKLSNINFLTSSPLFLKQNILDMIINNILSIDSHNFKIGD